MVTCRRTRGRAGDAQVTGNEGVEGIDVRTSASRDTLGMETREIMTIRRILRPYCDLRL